MDSFIGEIRIFAFDFAPENWAYCVGTTMPIQQNPALYVTLGGAYGATKTTFNLPDLRAMVPMGAGSGPGLTPRKLGGTAGATTAQVNESQMPAHNHDLNARVVSGSVGMTATPAAGDWLSRLASVNGTTATYIKTFTPPSPTPAPVPPTLTPIYPATIGPSGGGAAHDNMQPYLAMTFAISLDGQYMPKPD